MTILKILSQPKYLTLAIAITLSIVAVAAWLPNLHLIANSVTSSTMTLWQKTNLLTSLLGSLQTNFTPLSRMVTILTALLAGTQASLLAFYIRQTARLQKSMGVSVLGVTTSILGVGCASCGSVVLTSLLGLGATTVVLNVFPLKGQEFGIIGIIILLFAIRLTLKKINQPMVCKVKKGE